MSDRTRSIELLNKAIGEELAAVHQYMYFHFRLDDLGFDLLANLFKRTAIAEMIHIEDLAERILFLKGEVEMAASAEVQKIADPDAILKLACEMESDSVEHYNAWAIECSRNADSISKQLFEKLVADEEAHLGQFETEMDNLERFGPNYLALQSIERSKRIATGGSEK